MMIIWKYKVYLDVGNQKQSQNVGESQSIKFENLDVSFLDQYNHKQ